jgi:acyl-CoA thioesterase
MTDFSELISGVHRDGNTWTAAVSEDWRQGRTLFGGLSAALCLEAAKREFIDLPPLRSAQFALVGPAAGKIMVRLSMLRRGKSTAFVSADLFGEEGLATRATFCFTDPRPSAYKYATDTMPAIKTPEQSTPFLGKPNFAQHFDNRLGGGNLPFSKAADPTMLFWMRHRDEALVPSPTALVALADAPPPAALVLFDQRAPVSTMTWAFDFQTDDLETEGGWWLIRVSAESVSSGYSSQAMTVWSSTGKRVLVGRQNVAVFG